MVTPSSLTAANVLSSVFIHLEVSVSETAVDSGSVGPGQAFGTFAEQKAFSGLTTLEGSLLTHQALRGS